MAKAISAVTLTYVSPVFLATSPGTLAPTRGKHQGLGKLDDAIVGYDTIALFDGNTLKRKLLQASLPTVHAHRGESTVRVQR